MIVQESSKLAGVPALLAGGWSGCSEARRKSPSVRPACPPAPAVRVLPFGTPLGHRALPWQDGVAGQRTDPKLGRSDFFLWNLTVEKNDPRCPLHPRGKKRKKRKSQHCRLKSLYRLAPVGPQHPSATSCCELALQLCLRWRVPGTHGHENAV